MWSWQNNKCPRKGNPKMPNISHCAGQAKSEGKYKKNIYIYLYYRREYKNMLRCRELGIV